MDALGGARGALLASLPTVGFVVGQQLGGLVAGAVGGTAAAVVVLLERLRGGHRVAPAVGGLLAVVALVLLTLRTGRASVFFLPAVLTLAAESAGLLTAAAVRRPVTGHVARALDAVPAGWRDDRRLLALFVRQDLLWSVLLALRAAVTAAFVLADSVAGAGLFRLTGTPMYVVVLAVCVRWARPHVAPGPVAGPPGAAAGGTGP